MALIALHVPNVLALNGVTGDVESEAIVLVGIPSGRAVLDVVDD